MSQPAQRKQCSRTDSRKGLARAMGSVLVIEYIWWGGHKKDAAHRWCAKYAESGEVWDYGALESLKAEAQKAGLSYSVMRSNHGKYTLIESWPNVELTDANSKKA